MPASPRRCRPSPSHPPGPYPEQRIGRVIEKPALVIVGFPELTERLAVVVQVLLDHDQRDARRVAHIRRAVITLVVQRLDLFEHLVAVLSDARDELPVLYGDLRESAVAVVDPRFHQVLSSDAICTTPPAAT